VGISPASIRSFLCNVKAIFKRVIDPVCVLAEPALQFFERPYSMVSGIDAAGDLAAPEKAGFPAALRHEFHKPLRHFIAGVG
jgi:hypothetical protein